MNGPFHDGELWVQERAGVRDMASRVGRSIHSEVPAAASEFLEERRFLVAGFEDTRGDVWASPLAGPPGFLSAPGGAMSKARMLALEGVALPDSAQQGFDF